MSYKKQESEIIETFSINMKRLRKQHNITQEELSFRAGLHRNYVSDTERGTRNISLKAIEKIANALNEDVREFFKK